MYLNTTIFWYFGNFLKKGNTDGPLSRNISWSLFRAKLPLKEVWTFHTQSNHSLLTVSIKFYNEIYFTSSEFFLSFHLLIVIYGFLLPSVPPGKSLVPRQNNSHPHYLKAHQQHMDNISTLDVAQYQLG